MNDESLTSHKYIVKIKKMKRPSGSVGTFLSNLERLYGIDIRSLALFRVLLGVLILFDLLIRLPDIRVFYTDWGVMPRWALIEKFSNPSQLSLHLMNGSTWFEALLFAVAFVFAFFLLVGYRTRLVTVVSWFLLLSLHNRNPAAIQGGDILFRMLLFWGMFLPLGAAYSVDRALDTSGKEPPRLVFSVASAALMIQVLILYWSAYATKTAPEWRTENTAVYYALNIDQLGQPFGQFLLRFPAFLKFLTFAVLRFELYGPFLLILPFFVGPFRTFAAFLFIAFHVALSSSLRLGPFPYICMTASVPFITSWFWDLLDKRFQRPEAQGLKVYYDGDCGFCKKSIFMIRTFFLLSSAEFRPAQEKKDIFEEMKRRDSWVVETSRGHRRYRFEGFIALIEASTLWRPWAALCRPKFVRDCGNKVYTYIAQHRPVASRLFSIFNYRRLRPDSSFLSQAVAAFFLVYVVLWNCSISIPRFQFFQKFALFGEVFSINQEWKMFSPYPLKDDGWYVIPGQLADGTEVDVLKGGGPVSWDKPKDVAGMYKTERWRKYMMYLSFNEYADYRLYYGRFLCRRWNEKHKDQPDKLLKTFQIYFMLETTLPDYQKPEIKKIPLWNHYCFEMPPVPA